MSNPKFKAVEDMVSLIAQVVHIVVTAPKPLTVSSLSLLLVEIPQFETLLGEISDLGPEFKALDLSESEALVELVVTNLAVTNQKAKDIISASLNLLKDGIVLFEALKEVPSQAV